MRILVPCEIRTDGSDNPFGYQLLKSLSLHPNIEEVQHGVSWLFEKDMVYDIILFQWLERIYRGKEPNTKELDHLRAYLNHWKGQSKIVVTIHNEYPHFNDSERFRELYELVFSYADGFIHFGESSKEILRSRYKKYFENAAEVVIPHGNYEGVPNNINKEEAREFLGFNLNDQILLCFGALRSRDELNLLVSSFRQAKKKAGNLKLLIAGKLPTRRRTELSYFIERISLWLRKDIRLVEGFIPQSDIQIYANAADVFMIPRITSLNSGNVALGFTFGKTVAGPNIGVIGEELRKTNNAVFNPEIPESASKAIVTAFEMQGSGRGEKNREYARTELDWEKVADKHVNFFRRL